VKIRLIIAGALLSLVLASSTACGGREETSLTVEVERGDLTITVSGSGTIEASNEANLSFGIGGRIEQLLVREGDTVAQGEVVAKLETDALALALAQADVAYAQAQLAVKQYDVAVSQATVAVTQAEINLKSAEIALEQTTRTSTLSDLRIAQADVDTAKRNLDDSLLTLSKYEPGSIGFQEYQKYVLLAQARLKAAQDKLDAMLGGFGTDEVIVKQQQVVAAEQSLSTAQESLELARLSAELSQQSLELAKQSREYAQKQLDKATIFAPFDGTIARLPVDEGDTILPTTIVAHLIEPGRMELKVQVDEIDIPDVKLGQRAIIEVDALPDLALEGKVGSIGSLPTQAAGVVVYDARVEFHVPEGVGLKAGMSATADVVITERDNVLLVPDRAVSKDTQGNTTVEVMVNGRATEKSVTIGVSDGLYTEILDGLGEGDLVIERQAKPKSSGLGLFAQ
jgi:HlyD family secretion protein